MEDIKGYEGLYKIDENGNIFSLIKNRFLSTRKDRWGYETVCLTKNKKTKALKIHRLVALQYIPNPDNKPQVNHKDFDKTNNNVNNLEWVTNQENIKHAYANGAMMGFKKIQQKVEQLNKETLEVINTFESVREASRKLNIHEQNISACCLGKIKSCGGYIFRKCND